MTPIVNMPEEDRATGAGNKIIGKDRACGSGDILADKQTHRQTDPQTDIFITPAGEVIMHNNVLQKVHTC